MDVFAILTLFGGLALFLYGMDLMGGSLRRQAGNSLQTILEKLTTNRWKGFFLGTIVTAVIQSSSATTVMVIGFINSGVMTLMQACGVIMGANVGTTVTAWLLSTTSISGSNVLLQLLKPSSFTPLLAFIGIVLHMFAKKDKTKNLGSILLGFAVLMFGMEAMTGAVEPLADDPNFTRLFTAFSNPLLGLLVGLVLTAIIQSSSASVGILQALSLTGVIPYSCAIPILMGQNIGASLPVMLSSIGANRDARRAAYLYLIFNVIGAVVVLALYMLIDGIFHPAFFQTTVDPFSIAVFHTGFKLLNTAVLLPLSEQMVKLTYLLVPETADPDAIEDLDERLMRTPAVAVEQSRRVSLNMAEDARAALLTAIDLLTHFSDDGVNVVQSKENRIDRYEDMLGTYLVKLSERGLSAEDRRDVSMMLHMIGDFERIGDHAVNLCEVAQELHEKKLSFSESARREIAVLSDAIREVLLLAMDAFVTGDQTLARRVEPLEQRVDDLTKELKSKHIERLQNGLCTIQMGFVLSDFTNNCERVADHCSNIAATLIESSLGELDMHDYTEHVIDSADYRKFYHEYCRKYSLEN